MEFKQYNVKTMKSYSLLFRSHTIIAHLLQNNNFQCDFRFWWQWRLLIVVLWTVALSCRWLPAFFWNTSVTSTLKMEAISYSETLVTTHKTTWTRNSEEHNRQFLYIITMFTD